MGHLKYLLLKSSVRGKKNFNSTQLILVIRGKITGLVHIEIMFAFPVEHFKRCLVIGSLQSFFFPFLSVYFGWFLAVSNEVLDNRSLEEILGSISPPPPPAMTNEAGAPRLMITHIVNQNFKSYAGEQTLGPFHKVSFFYLKHFFK